MGARRAAGPALRRRVWRLMKALCARLDPGSATLFAGHLFVLRRQTRRRRADANHRPDLWRPPRKRCRSASTVALGHVHRPQRCPARRSARYAGSLLQLDFGETEPEEERRQSSRSARLGRPKARESDQRRPAAARRQRDDGELAKYAETADSVLSAGDAEMRRNRARARRRGTRTGCRTESTPRAYARTEVEAPLTLRGLSRGNSSPATTPDAMGSPASDAMLDCSTNWSRRRKCH